MTWKPIATAPKDRIILAFHKQADGPYTCHWVPAPFEPELGRWQLVVCGTYCDDNDVEPEIWRDCPKPPNERKNT